MDESLKKLDVSHLPLGPARPVALPERPISLWLRLAHVYSLGVAHPTGTGLLRVLSDFELVLQLEESSWIWSERDGGSVHVPPRSVVFIPPGFVHAWGNELGTHIAVHFDLHAQPELLFPGNMHYLGPLVEPDPLPFVPSFELRLTPSERPLVVPLVTQHAAPQSWSDQLGALVELWSRRKVATLDAGVRIAEALGFALTHLAVHPEGIDPRADPRILGLLHTLDRADGASIARRTTVPQLAALVHMGEAAFREAFVRTVGCSPRRYLEERRIERAARALVETDRLVAEISRAAGYQDPYHFSRVFRRVTGVSPRQYRLGAPCALSRRAGAEAERGFDA